MDQAFIPIQFDKSHLTTIGVRLYTKELSVERKIDEKTMGKIMTEIKLMFQSRLMSLCHFNNNAKIDVY